MIIISNPFVFPILVIIWSMDAWLWLASVRLILEKLIPNNQLTISLSKIVDPLAKLADRLMLKYLKKRLPQWLSWIAIFFTLISIRYLLISLIVLN